MAKYSGMLGYVMPAKEDPPGIWKPSAVVEKLGRGDLFGQTINNEDVGGLSDGITVNNQLSIIMDPFVYRNLESLKYVILYGTRWEIQSLSINRPRVILTLGGVYNGEYPSTDHD